MQYEFLTIITLALAVFAAAPNALSQESGISQEELFANPPIKPEKDLDIYGYSTMEKSDFGGTDSESTFNQPIEELDNEALNQPTEEELEEAKELQKQTAEGLGPEGDELSDFGSDFDSDFADEGAGESAGATVPKLPKTLKDAGISKTGKLYKWVDSEGVIHVTNNIGFVPYDRQVQSALDSDEEGEAEGEFQDFQ